MSRASKLGSLAVAAALVAGSAAAQDAMFIDANGNVGIGTNTPTTPLYVFSELPPPDPGTVVVFENDDGPARFRFRNGVNGETWNVGHTSPSGTGVVFSDVGDGVSELRLDVAGNLIIAGTLTAGNPPDTFPDYVFEPDYELMPLGELSEFVRENGHLPNVPSKAEVEKAGQLNLSEFQLRLLEKIEELTLYTLQQKEQIDNLSAQVAQLQRGNTAGSSN